MIVLLMELVYVGFTMYFILHEGNKIRKHRLKYFKDFWNLLEFATLSMSITAIAMYAMKKIFGSVAMNTLHESESGECIHFLYFRGLFNKYYKFTKYFIIIPLIPHCVYFKSYILCCFRCVCEFRHHLYLGRTIRVHSGLCRFLYYPKVHKNAEVQSTHGNVGRHHQIGHQRSQDFQHHLLHLLLRFLHVGVLTIWHHACLV